MPFLLLNNLNDINCGHVSKCVMRSIIFWTIFFIKFGSKLYRQIVSIPMGTNCDPLVADLFLFCYERDFMLSPSDHNQTDIKVPQHTLANFTTYCPSYSRQTSCLFLFALHRVD